MMKINTKIRKYSLLAIAMCAITISSCGDDDNPKPPVPNVDNNKNYVLMTADNNAEGIPGYITALNEIPKGEINSNIMEGAISTQGSGFYAFGKYAFQRMSNSRANSALTAGIQRYSVNSSGTLIKDGFISAPNPSMHIVNNELGFYFDKDKGLTKIQTFNPSTMQRTGEIDLSTAITTNFEYLSIGENILVSKGSKLYAGVTYGSKDGHGSFFTDPALGYADLVVIDIPTLKYEKTIRTNKISYIGYPGNHNQFWDVGDDGALYLASHGLYPKGAKGSAIVRIKKNDTDFDDNWILKADDYTQGTTLGNVLVKNGKLYTSIGSKPMDLMGIAHDAFYEYYEFDVENIAGSGKKIEGLLPTQYAFQNGHTIIEIDNKLLFNVVDDNKSNAYYELKDGKGELLFNLKEGDRLMGFAELDK